MNCPKCESAMYWIDGPMHDIFPQTIEGWWHCPNCHEEKVKG